MKYLLLFDIDGTILKLKKGFSRDLFRMMINDLFKRELPPEEMPDFAGATDLWIIRSIGRKLGFSNAEIDELLPVIYHKIATLFNDASLGNHISLLPGIERMIPALGAMPEFTLGLLTGNIIENAYLKLSHFGLDRYFPFGAFGSDNEDRNKLPAIAIERANMISGENVFRAENTMIIGDTLKDIECAGINGIPACAVATGYTPFEALSRGRPELVYNNFSDFDAVINSIKCYFEYHSSQI